MYNNDNELWEIPPIIPYVVPPYTGGERQGLNMFNFKSVAKASVGGSPIMNGESLKTMEIINQKLTITAVDEIELTNKQGKKQNVAVLNFAEFPNRYYLGGKALTNIVSEWRKAWASEHNGEIELDEMNGELKKAKVVITLTMTTTHNGNTFTMVNIE